LRISHHRESERCFDHHCNSKIFFGFQGCPLSYRL
jgi:hypothetical protein